MSEFLIAGGNTSDQAKEYAANEGLVVREPKEDELFIDIDDFPSSQEFDRNYDIVDRAIGIRNWKATPSRNKLGGRHIVVRLWRNVTPIERIALQAILGSDRRREAHSFARIEEGDKSPTLFFEKPKEKLPTVDDVPTDGGVGGIIQGWK
jgi:hypothetical protein